MSDAMKNNGIMPKAAIKSQPKDFVVEEITPEGTLIEVGKTYTFDNTQKGDFLVFALEKKNTDTFIAIKNIAKSLKISDARITVAGIKDKKAITAQRASAHKIKKEQIEKIKLETIKITPLNYGKKVYLGALDANRFTITVRNIIESPESIKKHIENKEKTLNGFFPNFFGEQRFGSSRPVSHVVGKHIISGAIRKAVETYVSMLGKTDSKELNSVRKNAFKDLNAAYRKFPFNCVYEKDILQHLIENKDDFAGALRTIPLGLRKMFVSAYQSDIFNRALFELIDNKKVTSKTKIPLPGYLFSSRIFSSVEDDVVENILKGDGVVPEMFRSEKMPELSSEGEKRDAFSQYNDFHIIDVSKDELNVGKTKAVLRFTLKKGCYATIFLRQFFEI